MSNQTSPSGVDFWLDTERYNDYIVDDPLDLSKKAISFSIDLIRLASIRKAVSNFVRILTRQSIPVYFNDTDINRNTQGKIIYISAKINTKNDFDVAVGQSLHEGAHTLLTDFDVISDMWANLPLTLLNMSDALDIRRTSIEKFIHQTWNIIEDRFIDNFVFNRSPGYRGYYVALYDRFWNSPRVDEILVSDEYRWPSLESYLFRICNLTNPNSDLTALPRLDEIEEVIDLSNIDRLKTTRDRAELAFKVTEIVLDCLEKEPPPMSGEGDPSDEELTPENFFGSGEGSGNGTDEGENEGEEKSEPSEDPGTKLIKEISDVIGGRDKTPEKFKENTDAVSKINKDNLSPQTEKLLKTIVENQQNFLTGKIEKECVTPEQKELLNLIEQHGISLVRVGAGLIPGDPKNLKVSCIVVEKMTKELIFKGQDVFPLSSVMKIGGDDPTASQEMTDAVRKGVLLGTKLGRKLQLRTDINPCKSLRKKSGKINRRQLHEAAFDAEDLFYKIEIETYNKAVLHITIDASGSMHGDKWLRTMTSVVAICKAASMIDNIHVTVSFRTTQSEKAKTYPYVVMAYNSNVDKFSKVKNLFPYLKPGGLTPEGLAFEAIMKLFEGITPDEEDRYFLNLSDGEPYFHFVVPETGECITYVSEVGVAHTRTQIQKIRRKDVQILSYFISDDGGDNLRQLLFNASNAPTRVNTNVGKVPEKTYVDTRMENFQMMYGKNAKFINVENIVDLARTMNELFLTKSREKIS